MKNETVGAIEFGMALFLIWYPVMVVISVMVNRVDLPVPLPILCTMPIIALLLGLDSGRRILRLSYAWNEELRGKRE